MQQHDANHASTSRVPREHIHQRISNFKRVIVVGAITAFGALWALAGTHAVSVTAQHAQQHPQQTTPDPGNFFNNAGNSDIGPGGNGGVASSGAS